MNHIQLFESFFSEEDSKIYEEDYLDEKEHVKAIVKTWVNDYVIPMIGFNYPEGEWTSEKDPKFKALVSKARAWLGKDSGIPRKSFLTDEIVGTYPNSSIVYQNLYGPPAIANANKTKYPLRASFYEKLGGFKEI